MANGIVDGEYSAIFAAVLLLQSKDVVAAQGFFVSGSGINLVLSAILTIAAVSAFFYCKGSANSIDARHYIYLVGLAYPLGRVVQNLTVNGSNATHERCISAMNGRFDFGFGMVFG